MNRSRFASLLLFAALLAGTGCANDFTGPSTEAVVKLVRLAISRFCPDV